MELKVDKDFEGLIQPLQASEFETLEDSILKEGCRDALVVWNDIIVDGHNRYRICKEHDVDFEVLHIDFDDKESVKLWMIDNQQGRRNLTKATRAVLAIAKKDIYAAMAKENQSAAGGDKKSLLSKMTKAKNDPINTREEMAKDAGVSTGTIAKMENVINTGTESLNEIVKKTDNDVSINLAEKVARQEEDIQEEFVEKVEAGEKPIDAYDSLFPKEEKPPQVEEPDNFKRLAKQFLTCADGMQEWADGTISPETKEEAIEAATVLNSAPYFIMQLARLGVDIEWCVEVARGNKDGKVQLGIEGKRIQGNEIIDIVAD